MNEKANEWHILGRLGAYFAIRLRMASIPLQGDQFFHIYGRKLKLYPVCRLGQTSVQHVK